MLRLTFLIFLFVQTEQQLLTSVADVYSKVYLYMNLASEWHIQPILHLTEGVLPSIRKHS